jgi:hypothetical protein
MEDGADNAEGRDPAAAGTVGPTADTRREVAAVPVVPTAQSPNHAAEVTHNDGRFVTI